MAVPKKLKVLFTPRGYVDLSIYFSKFQETIFELVIASLLGSARVFCLIHSSHLLLNCAIVAELLLLVSGFESLSQFSCVDLFILACKVSKNVKEDPNLKKSAFQMFLMAEMPEEKPFLVGKSCLRHLINTLCCSASIISFL